MVGKSLRLGLVIVIGGTGCLGLLKVMASASQTHDAQEGMRSFIEKRRPRFENR